MASELEDVDAQIKVLQAKRDALLTAQRGDKLQEVKEIIKQFGFTPEDLGLADVLVPAMITKKARKVQPKMPPKYADPTDPSKTWAGGKGARPSWVREHLEKGGKLEDLLITKPMPLV